MNFGQNDLTAVNYDLSIQNGAVRFYPVKNSNRPDYADNMVNFVKQLNQVSNEERTQWKMTTKKSFNHQRAKVGDLRSAF